jgi:hypothetical protein
MLCGLFWLSQGRGIYSQECRFDPTVALMLEDVAVDRHDNPAMVKIRLKRSKTDPFRHGVDIFLGRTHRDLCPVSALLAYIAVRPAVVGPLFVFGDGSFLTRERLVDAVRSALRQAGTGIDASHFTGHSFGIGAATVAAQSGIQDSTIKCWDDGSHQPISDTSRPPGRLWLLFQHS